MTTIDLLNQIRLTATMPDYLFIELNHHITKLKKKSGMTQLPPDAPTPQTAAALICILSTALIAIWLWGKAFLLKKNGSKARLPDIDDDHLHGQP